MARGQSNYHPPATHKLLHFGAGFAAGSSVAYSTNKISFGIAAGAIAGVGRELYETKVLGSKEPMQWHINDAAITTAGGIVGGWIAHRLKKRQIKFRESAEISSTSER